MQRVVLPIEIKSWVKGVRELYTTFNFTKPRNLILTPAADSDITIFKELIAPTLKDMTVFADKIYNDDTLEKYLKEYQNVDLLPIQKRYRGQMILNADDELYNTLKSQCRQPIESFFNWINEKTGIQCASKVRSSKGLYVHVLGRLAAVFFHPFTFEPVIRII